MTENIRRIVIFGENSSANTVFYTNIKRFLTADKNSQDLNKNNYLEIFFEISGIKYLLISTSSNLFSSKNDNLISREEKIINQELLLTSDLIYLLINIDSMNLDYNLEVQKYFNQKKKKHLVVFSSSSTTRIQFEDILLTNISLQRIIKNSSHRYFFFSLDSIFSQMKEFVHDEFFVGDFGRNWEVNTLSDHKIISKLTIFGPPNSGKSTLLNSLLGKKRSIVSPLAGTTRENVLSLFQWKGVSFELKDTEGVTINKRNDRSILSNCQISWVVLDSTKTITKKILQIVNLAEKCDQALVIILNKIDIATSQQINERKREICSRLKSFSFVPVIPISAYKKDNLSCLLTALEYSINQSQLVFSKTLLAEQFSKLLEKNPPAAINGRYLKIYYALHEKGFVHKFIVFVNNPQLVHFSYYRYIVNYLRRSLQINSLPIKLFFKKS